MSIFRQFALLVLAACPGLMLLGCQPSTESAPSQPTLVSIAVEPVAPGSTTVAVGATQALTVTGTYSDSSTFDLTCGSQFASSDTSVATVGATGLVTATGAGEATITAKHVGAGGACAQTGSGQRATVTITVPRPPLVSIAVTPATTKLTRDETQALSVSAVYADASTEPLTSGVTFTSSDDLVATVSPEGVVTGGDPGTATITATQAATGKTTTARINVNISEIFETITFEDSPAVSYTFSEFGGTEPTTRVADPAGGGNLVARAVKSATALSFAGTVVSTRTGDTVGKIPFTAANTRMSVRVWSPDAGIQVLLKVEDSSKPPNTVTVEARANTTVANAWETLTFDFANNPPSGPALDLANRYDRLVIFFNFGVSGAAAGGAKTYFYDDVTFIGGTGAFSTVTFDLTTIGYRLVGFAGAENSSVQADPAGGANRVARVVRSATAQDFAGTVVSTRVNLAAPPPPPDRSLGVGKIPFDAANTRVTVRVWSPDAGIQVRLKVEDSTSTNPVIAAETEATTTVVNTWETLTFDFANPFAGTPALNFASSYDTVIIFFNFGVTGGAAGGARTYYFDDVTFGP